MRCPICDEEVKEDAVVCQHCGSPLEPSIKEQKKEDEDIMDFDLDSKLQEIENAVLSDMMADIEGEPSLKKREATDAKDETEASVESWLEQYEANVSIIFFHLGSGRIDEAKQELFDLMITHSKDKMRAELERWQNTHAKRLDDWTRLERVQKELDAIDLQKRASPFKKMIDKVRQNLADGDIIESEKSLLEFKLARDAWNRRQAFQKRIKVQAKKDFNRKKEQRMGHRERKKEFHKWLKTVEKKSMEAEVEREGAPPDGKHKRPDKCSVCGVKIENRP